MTLLFSDGMDNYTSVSDLNANYDLINSGNTTLTIYKTGGATNQGYVWFDASNNGPLGFAKGIPTSAQLYTATWFRVQTSRANTNTAILNFSNAPCVSSDGFLYLQDYPGAYSRVTVGMNFDFRLCIMYDSVVVATGQSVIANIDWRHLEVYMNWSSGTDGYVEVRLNGVTEVTYSGPTWNGTGQNGVSWITTGGTTPPGGQGGSSQCGYDDLIIFTPGGTAPSTWMGPQVIETLRPTGPGSLTQGTPSPVLNNTTDHGAHLYWRLRITDLYEATVVDISELVFLATLNGADLCQGGTAIASGYNTSYDRFGTAYAMPPAHAFDGLTTTCWGSPSPAIGSWLGYEFNAPVDPHGFSIQPGTDPVTGGQVCSLSGFVIEYSDDGNAWTLAASYSTSHTWAANELRIFPIIDGNYARVYEQTPDGDTGYVEFDSVGQKETYTFNPTTDPNRTITLISVNLTTKGSGASPRKVAGICKSGGQSGQSASVDVAPLSNYHTAQTLFYTDPATGAAWTAAGLDAAEFGLTLVL